jgi:hypothetical protein
MKKNYAEICKLASPCDAVFAAIALMAIAVQTLSVAQADQ